MQYKPFIYLMQSSPVSNYQGELATNHNIKQVRDALIESIVLEFENKKILHELAAMDMLLKSLGIHIRIEDSEKESSEKQRIIIESEIVRQEKSTSMLVDWQYANTAAYRNIIGVVEHQLMKYVIILQEVERALQKLHPEILNFLKDYPKVSIVDFARQYCAIRLEMENNPLLCEQIHAIYASDDNTHVELPTAINQILGENDNDKQMWRNFFKKVDMSSKPKSALSALEKSIQKDDVLHLMSLISQAESVLTEPLNQQAPLDQSTHIREQSNFRPS